MTKSEFIDILRARTAVLPEAESAKTVIFWSEMIDDRMEDGMSEEEAVEALGDVDSIVSEVLEGVPEASSEKTEETKRKKRPGWVVPTLICTFPVWISLLAAAFVVVVALYATVLSAVWGIAVSIAVTEIALFAAGGAVLLVGVLHLSYGRYGAGLFYGGAGLVLLGLALLLLRPVLGGMRLAAYLTKQIFVLPVRLIRKKGKSENGKQR